MSRRLTWMRATMALIAFVALNAHAADALPTVDLSAEGSVTAANDLARADAYVEASADDPATVARQVNGAIASALERAKRVEGVSVKTTGTSTWPIYAKDSRTISGWRMRSNLQLESTDIAALSRLIAELQSTLAIGNLQLMPAPQTLRAANDAAIRDALRAFEARAKLVAEALGRRHRLKAMSIHTQGGPAPVFRARMMADMSAAPAPAPIEAGDSTVVVQVNGTIELID